MLRRLLVIGLCVFSVNMFVANADEFCDSKILQALYGECETAPMSADLPQSLTVSLEDLGGEMTVSYPDGWFAMDDLGSILISNTEDAFTMDPSIDDVPPRTVVVNMTILPAEMGSVMGLDADPTVTEVLELVAQFMAGGDVPEFGEIEEIEINGITAAQTSGSDDSVAMTLYTVIQDRGFVIGLGATRADEAGSQDELIQSIVASTIFTATD